MARRNKLGHLSILVFTQAIVLLWHQSFVRTCFVKEPLIVQLTSTRFKRVPVPLDASTGEAVTQQLFAKLSADFDFRRWNMLSILCPLFSCSHTCTDVIDCFEHTAKFVLRSMSYAAQSLIHSVKLLLDSPNKPSPMVFMKVNNVEVCK